MEMWAARQTGVQLSAGSRGWHGAQAYTYLAIDQRCPVAWPHDSPMPPVVGNTTCDGHKGCELAGHIPRK